MIVSKFLHTRMRVNDLKRTLEFYQRVFGLEVTRRHESPRGSKLAFLAVPNSDEEIEITYFPGSGPVRVQEDLMHLAFEVENLDDVITHQTACNIKTELVRVDEYTGKRFTFFSDPDELPLEIYEC